MRGVESVISLIHLCELHSELCKTRAMSGRARSSHHLQPWETEGAWSSKSTVSAQKVRAQPRPHETLSQNCKTNKMRGYCGAFSKNRWFRQINQKSSKQQNWGQKLVLLREKKVRIMAFQLTPSRQRRPQRSEKCKTVAIRLHIW